MGARDDIGKETVFFSCGEVSREEHAIGTTGNTLWEAADKKWV